MSDLTDQLASYSHDLDKLVKITPKQFDIATVATMITSVPERKWNAAQGIVNATIAKKDADQKLRVIKAMKMMLAKNMPNLTAAPDRQAWVDSQEVVQDAEIKVIDCEAELLASKLAYESLDNLYEAGKRVMTWLIEQDKAERDYSRYANEGKRNA